MLSLVSLLAVAGIGQAAMIDRAVMSSSAVPDYFMSTPDAFPGPTKTGSAPFLAATNPAPFGMEASFVANSPLETALPISGNTNNTSIFKYMANLSPYLPSTGFGANEYPLPPGCNISLVNVIHRHGSRYPTGTSSVSTFGALIHNITSNGTAKFTGELAFLNTYKYQLGAEILVPKGRQELFDSGVLHYYNYGQLYNTSTKIIARTTTQDRMLKSAEYFMAGFFGLEWTNNATLEVIIEQNGYNDTLAGYYACNNSNLEVSAGGTNASLAWEKIYLKNATARLQKYAGSYNWTIADSYNAQTLCPYETVAFGYSQFCDLFTLEEWEGFEYSLDLSFYGNDMFGSPTGRGVGIGYAEEIYARLQGHLYNLTAGETNVNVTLDDMSSTFPLNQSLYFDFSHDTNIASVLTALGLTQFAQFLPETGPPANQQMIVSHMEPFAARFTIEVIEAPAPVLANRSATNNMTTTSYYASGNATKYVHFLLNQRTIPLHMSYSGCETRADGWCEMSAFMSVLSGLLTTAQYEYACYGKYAPEAPGNITNGVPLATRALGGGMGSGLTLKRASDQYRA